MGLDFSSLTSKGVLNNALNCWKTLKTIKLQRNTSNGINVNVAKAEKINCMRTRLNPLFFFLMGNQHPRPKGKVQRLSLGEI